MPRRIYGKVRDQNHGGTPIEGLKIRAWDEDLFDGDDFMGDGITGPDGNFQIKYSDTFWDSSVPGLSTHLPDIYITVEIRNKSGKWVRIEKSPVFHNHDLREDLRIDFDVDVQPFITRMTRFDPVKNAFKFRNGF